MVQALGRLYPSLLILLLPYPSHQILLSFLFLFLHVPEDLRSHLLQAALVQVLFVPILEDQRVKDANERHDRPRLGHGVDHFFGHHEVLEDVCDEVIGVEIEPLLLVPQDLWQSRQPVVELGLRRQCLPSDVADGAARDGRGRAVGQIGSLEQYVHLRCQVEGLARDQTETLVVIED